MSGNILIAMGRNLIYGPLDKIMGGNKAGGLGLLNGIGDIAGLLRNPMGMFHNNQEQPNNLPDLIENLLEDIKEMLEQLLYQFGRQENTALNNSGSSLDSGKSSKDPGKSSNSQMTLGNLPATQKMNETEKFDLYSNIINEHGSDKAKQDLANGKKVTLSLREDTNTNVNNGKGRYDDRMVLLWKDANGVKHVKEYKANLDPTSQYEQNSKYCRKPMGADHNGDGRLDLGRLADGTYTYKKGTFMGKAAFLSSSDQVSERDVNHNGIFDDNAKSQRGNRGMYIHIGGENNTYSAGCFTMPPGVHSQFFQAVENQQTLTNVVVNTNKLS